MKTQFFSSAFIATSLLAITLCVKAEPASLNFDPSKELTITNLSGQGKDQTQWRDLQYHCQFYNPQLTSDYLLSGEVDVNTTFVTSQNQDRLNDYKSDGITSISCSIRVAGTGLSDFYDAGQLTIDFNQFQNNDVISWNPITTGAYAAFASKIHLAVNAGKAELLFT